MKTFLNEAMADKGMSVIDLSAASGISMKQIERFKAHKLTPSLLEASKLAVGLNITLDEFVNGLKQVEMKEEKVVDPNEELSKEIEAIEAELGNGDFEDDDKEEEMLNPKEAFELALRLNKNMNVIATADIAEAYRLINNLDKLCLERVVFIHTVEDEADTHHLIYVVYEAFGETLKSIHELSKHKMFEKLPKEEEMIAFVKENATFV